MNSFEFYWKLTRPHTLPASIIPPLVGISYALYADMVFHPVLALVMILCAMLIQIATNLFNEYYDFKNGLDTKDTVGIGGAIVREGIAPKAVLAAAFGIYGISGILGVVLAWNTSWILLLIGAVCLLIGYCYTGGPIPISRSPFGEAFAGTLMGTGYCMIAYYTQTGHITWGAFAVSIPINILVGLLLTANSLRDLVPDKANGRRTLAILLGHERTLLFMISGFTLAYFWLFVLLAYGHSVIILLPLLSIPFAVHCVTSFESHNQTPRKMMRGMIYCSKTNKYFGILFIVALFVEALIKIIF